MLTYEEYTNLGFISVSETQFPRYLTKAHSYLEYITFNKVDQEHPQWVQDKINVCECEVMDILLEHDNKIKAINESDSEIISSGLKSETIKSHSATFRDVSKDNKSDHIKSTDTLINSTIRRLLLPTGLLYRGL